MKKSVLFGIYMSLFPCLSMAATETIEVHGHRGARGSRPENTLPAFDFAIENGADVLELDVAVSKDNQFVISHEPALTPERCLDPSGEPLKASLPIHQLTYDEIKKYDCGTLPNKDFPRQVAVPHTPMPRLQDLFEMVQKSPLPGAEKVRFNIETKIYPSRPDDTPDPDLFTHRLLTLIKQYRLTSRVIIQSFDNRTLIAAKKMNKRIKTSMLTSDNHIDFVAIAKSTHVNIISPHYEWILPEDVKNLHDNHVKVIPWTANDPKEWDRMIEMKVDGMITDHPEELVKYLRTRASTHSEL